MANPIQKVLTETKRGIVTPILTERSRKATANQAYQAANSPLTGTPEEVIAGLYQRQQAASDALDQYEQTGAGAYIRDYGNGILWKVTGVNPATGEPNRVIDEQGTKLLAGMLAAEERMNSYADYFGSKFGPSGGGSAGSYLSSERDRVAEAERYYNDFINRVGDIASLESIQSEGVKKFSDMFKQVGEYNAAMNKAKAEGTATMASPRMGVRSGRAPNTDYAAIANSIKGTLPSSAPGMAQIDPSAFSSGGGGASTTVTTGVGATGAAPPPQSEATVPEQAPNSRELLDIPGMAQPSTLQPGEVNVGAPGMTDAQRIQQWLEEFKRRTSGAPNLPTGGLGAYANIPDIASIWKRERYGR